MIESRWGQSPLTLADLMVGPHGSMSAYITADNYQVQSWPPRLQGPHLAFMQVGQHYDSAFAYLCTTSRISRSKESRRQDHATSVKPGWMQSRMMRMWRVLEPIPIRDAAPMSAAGFASVAIEAAILNHVIGHADPLVIEQHLDAGGSDPVMRRTAIPFIAAARLSTMIL
jgi:hypothetical protein